MRNYIYLAMLFFILEGCLVISKHSYWYGNFKNNENIEFYNNNPKPFISVSLERDDGFFPFIPFLIFSWDKNDYRISCSFETSTNEYEKVDSLFYQIYDSKDSLLTFGIEKSFDRFTKQDFHCNDSALWAKFGVHCFSEYRTMLNLKLSIKNEAFVKINLIVYFTMVHNNIKYEYKSYILKKQQSKKFTYWWWV